MGAKFVPNPAGIQKMLAQVKANVGDQVNQDANVAIQRVRRRYAGESVDEVYRAIVDEIRHELGPDLAPGYRPNEARLRELSQAIVDGTLED